MHTHSVMTTVVWVVQPRAAERVPVTPSGFGCAATYCCPPMTGPRGEGCTLLHHWLRPRRSAGRLRARSGRGLTWQKTAPIRASRLRTPHPSAWSAASSVKIAAYQQQYADNQNISFLPAIVSTSTRMHGELLRLLFYRPTGRLRHTSLPLECHRKTSTRKHSGSSARHSTTA